jgi:NIPSNAP
MTSRVPFLLFVFALTLSAIAPLAAEETPGAAEGGRVFELRTYTAAPGKLDALNARFRDHTVALFKKHGMEVVGFWMPVDKDAGAGEKLVYLLAFPSRAAAQASWKAFREDPEWVKVKAESETAGTLAPKIESVFLTATDYSPLK